METSTQETAAWNPAEYVWDPHRLVAAQGSSATNLHLNVAAAGSQPDSVVPPVLAAAAPTLRTSTLTTRCKIEGCQQLLKDEKPYYQRFMVCEEHMRSLSLQINGQSCRFCQQCGRFEPLQAFDGAKRSCRARLQEHNKRRRKVGLSSKALHRQRRNAAASSRASRATETAKRNAAAAAAAAAAASSAAAAETTQVGGGTSPSPCSGDDVVLEDAETTPADSSNVCNKLRKLTAGDSTGGSESGVVKHTQPQYNILAAADSGSERSDPKHVIGQTSPPPVSPSACPAAAAAAAAACVSGRMLQEQQPKHDIEAPEAPEPMLHESDVRWHQGAATSLVHQPHVSGPGSSAATSAPAPVDSTAVLPVTQLAKSEGPNWASVEAVMATFGSEVTCQDPEYEMLLRVLGAQPLEPGAEAAATAPAAAPAPLAGATPPAVSAANNCALIPAGGTAVQQQPCDGEGGSGARPGSQLSPKVLRAELAGKVTATASNILGLPLQVVATAAEVEELSAEELLSWQHMLLGAAAPASGPMVSMWCNTGNCDGAGVQAALAASNQRQRHPQQGVLSKPQLQQQPPSTAARECTLQDQLLLDQLLLESGLLQGPGPGIYHSQASVLPRQVPSCSRAGPGVTFAPGDEGNAAVADGDAARAHVLLAELMNDVAVDGQRLHSATAVLAASAATPAVAFWHDSSSVGLAGHQYQHQQQQQQQQQLDQQQRLLQYQRQQQQQVEPQWCQLPLPADCTAHTPGLCSVSPEAVNASQLSWVQATVAQVLGRGNGSLGVEARDDSARDWRSWVKEAPHKQADPYSLCPETGADKALDQLLEHQAPTTAKGVSGAATTGNAAETGAAAPTCTITALGGHQRESSIASGGSSSSCNIQGKPYPKQLAWQQQQQHVPSSQQRQQQQQVLFQQQQEVQQVLLQQQQQQLVHSKAHTGPLASRQRLQVQQLMRVKQELHQRQQQLMQRQQVQQQLIQQQQQAQQQLMQQRQQTQQQLVQQQLVQQQQQAQQQQSMTCHLEPQGVHHSMAAAEFEDWQVDAQLYQLLQQADTQAAGGSAASSAAFAAGNCQSVMYTSIQQQQQQYWQQWTAAPVAPAPSKADDNLASAMLIAQGGGAGASYAAADTTMRLSVKLHNHTPSRLQPELRQRMDAMLGAAGCAVESGFVKAGCVHLTLQLRAPVRCPLLVPAQQQQRQLVQPAQAALADSLTQMLLSVDAQTWSWALLDDYDDSSDRNKSSTAAAAMEDNTPPLAATVQLPGQKVLSIVDPAVQVPGDTAAAASGNDSSSSSTCTPCLQGLLPCCVTSERRQVTLQATGTGLLSPGVTVLARSQGMYLPASASAAAGQRHAAECVGSANATGDMPSGLSSAAGVSVYIQRLQPYGLVYVEFQQGQLLSEGKPLLVVEEPQVAAELEALQQQVAVGGCKQVEAEQVLIDLGRVLDFRAVAERHCHPVLQPSGQTAAHSDVDHKAAALDEMQSIGHILRKAPAIAALPTSAFTILPQHGGIQRQEQQQHHPEEQGEPRLESCKERSRVQPGTLVSGGSSICSSSRRLVLIESSDAHSQRLPSSPAGTSAGRSILHRVLLDSVTAAASSTAATAAQQADGGSASDFDVSNISSSSPRPPLISLSTPSSMATHVLRRQFGLSNFDKACSLGSYFTQRGTGFDSLEMPLRNPGPNAVGVVVEQLHSDLLAAAAAPPPGAAAALSCPVAAATAAGTPAVPAVSHSCGDHPLLGIEYKTHMMDVGVALLCYCLDRGWPATCQMVLDVLLAHAAPVCSFAAVAAAVADRDGLGLLHRAVRSGSSSMVLTVLRWGEKHSCCFSWDAKGPLGLTPLHLAALLDCCSNSTDRCTAGQDSTCSSSIGSQADVAAFILRSVPEACVVWFSAASFGSATPASLAAANGYHHLNQLASKQLDMPAQQQQQQQQGGQPAGQVDSLVWKAAAAAATATAAEQQAALLCGSVMTAHASPASSVGQHLQHRLWQSPALGQHALLPGALLPGAALGRPDSLELGMPCDANLTGSEDAGTAAASQKVAVVAGSMACDDFTACSSSSPAKGAAAVATGGSDCWDNSSRVDNRCSQASQIAAVCLDTLQQRLLAQPALLSAITVGLEAFNMGWLLLMMVSLVAGSSLLLLLALLGMVVTGMLQRLVAALVQPGLLGQLADAALLELQLADLARCARVPLLRPHSKLTLTFTDRRLEMQYCKALADARTAMDALVSAIVKALVIFTPVLLRVGSFLPASWAAPTSCWALPVSQQIAGAAIAALPPCAQLLGPGCYGAVRDAVLAAGQALLLAVLRQALLLTPGTACVLPGQQRMFGLVSAVLLVSVQQRMCWAIWQPALNAAICVLLSSCGGSWSMALLSGGAGGSVGAGQYAVLGLLQHLLMPVCVLPLIYLREQIDRNMFVASVSRDAHQLVRPKAKCA